MSSSILMMNLVIFGATALAFVIFVGRAKRKEDPRAQAKMEANCLKRHPFYLKFAPTKSSYAAHLKAFSVYGVSSEKELAVMSVQVFDKAIIFMLILVIAGFVIFRNIIYTLMFGFFGYVYMQSSLISHADRIVADVYKELSYTISLFRQAYLSTASVDKAFIVADIPPRLKPVFDKMQRIITNQKESELRELIDSYPITVVGTLASTLYLNSIYGAQKTGSGGDSLESLLLVLEQECDSEYRNCMRIKGAFATLDIMALLGLVVWPLSEAFMKKQIPGLVTLLDGMYGQILHLVIIIVTIFTYNFITNSKRYSVASSSDVNDLIVGFYKIPSISNIISNLTPKSEKKKKKLETMIREASSGKTITYITAEKFIYFVVTFVFTLVALFVSTASIRSNFKNNYNSLSLIPSSLKETQKTQLKRFDDEFLNISQAEYENYKTDDEVLSALIKQRITGLSDMELSEQVSRIRTKYEIYVGAVPKFYWPFIALAVALLSTIMPTVTLKKRKKDLINEIGDEVASLQVLMLVLSYSNVSCEETLRLLEMQSKVLKTSIRNAIVIYKRNPNEALDYLLSVTDNVEFKHIVNKLYSCVYDISISSAFADMGSQRQQTASISEILRQESLEKKKNTARLISFLPGGIALIGCFVAPVLILGLGQMSSITSGLG